jgi:hypothetical protein
MASNVITGQQWGPPAVGTRDGNWVWNGSNWICNPDCGTDGSCPPFGPPVFSGPVAQPPWYPGANGGVSFGATAPANPVRGHMWWDGSSMWLFDGAAWVAIGGQGSGGGAATGTTPPANPFTGQQWFNGSVLYIWDGNAWVPTSTTKSYVQATAPPNPNPGDTWFDGTVQRIWDGSAWRTVGPGATVGPVPTTTKVFTMVGVSPITLGTSGASVIVPFTATPTIDTSTGWDATSKKYTPKVAGNYFFFTRTYIGGPNQEAYGVDTLLWNDNGSWQANAQYVVAVAGAYVSAGNTDYLNAAGLIHMNGSTDFVRFWSSRPDGLLYTIGPSVPVIEAWLMP